MKIKNIKKGFTLIELLIVMGIISVIIAVTIMSYSSVNKRIALDIAANKIENLIIEMREKTRSGYSVDDESHCFGFIVKKEGTINQLIAPYNRLKEKNNKCNRNETESYGINDLDKNIVVNDIKLFGNKNEDFTMFFSPPNAVPELETGAMFGSNKFLQIVIGLKGDTNENDQRVILLNMLTGNTFTDRFNEKYK
jgi:prepilin-type N-terminal cleavage/methylation domain-containing protein